MGLLAALQRTLDQEVLALLGGARLECLVCDQPVMRLGDGSLLCLECGSSLRSQAASQPELQLETQAG